VVSWDSIFWLWRHFHETLIIFTIQLFTDPMCTVGGDRGAVIKEETRIENVSSKYKETIMYCCPVSLPSKGKYHAMTDALDTVTIGFKVFFNFSALCICSLSFSQSDDSPYIYIRILNHSAMHQPTFSVFWLLKQIAGIKLKLCIHIWRAVKILKFSIYCGVIFS